MISGTVRSDTLSFGDSGPAFGLFGQASHGVIIGRSFRKTISWRLENFLERDAICRFDMQGSLYDAVALEFLTPWLGILLAISSLSSQKYIVPPPLA